MTSKHTPGPWWPVQNSLDRWYVTTYRDHETATTKPTRFGATVAHGIGDHTEKRTSGNEEANARLIAAAPDLLDALEAFLNEADAGHVSVDTDRAARAAIAKARGNT
jgi:hypothetical protein